MFITVINEKRTYNLREIMQQAWVIFRTSKKSFSESLKKAWARAKSVMQDILAVEEQAAEQKALFQAYKAKIGKASTEEEMEAILDDALDHDIEPKYYSKLEAYACSLL